MRTDSHHTTGFSLAPVIVTLLLTLFLSPDATSRARSETPAKLPVAIHPVARQTAAPDGGTSVSVNPPPLLWPTQSSRAIRYSVRLSQNSQFPPEATIRDEGLPWAMFNPHAKLDSGQWYWQYGWNQKPGAQTKWSKVFSFRVDDSARPFVTPEAGQVLASCPKDRPRLLSTSADLAALRERAKANSQASAAIGVGKRLLARELPDLDRALPSKKGKNQYEQRNFSKWASKAFGGDLLGTVKSLVNAYLVTGEERFGRAAVRWAVFVAELDPDGATSRSVSDFADGSCMEAMALAYDTCYELFDEDQKALMRAALKARGERFFSRCINRLEGQVFSAHIWQHILMQGTEVAFALLGEEPEAEVWAAYVYELWTARFPLLGGDDGGWANGLNYFGTNFHTLIEMPRLFGRLTGVDFFDHAWYRNAPYYQMYCWPPGSASDGFGDGAERESAPSASRGTFVKTLGEKFADPHALWYAKQILGDRYGTGRTATNARLPEPKPPADLPQARAFRDVGIVSMHTDLADTPGDLMIGFRSSPYGSYNHMHSDQNSLNILFGGKRLFSGSGYYIAYGDDHFNGWYTHTRGHNSVLIDGKGQVRGSNGYGRIARFLHGSQVSYALGDASTAYGDAGLTKFRRHLAFLRPGTIVVYDELEADHPAEWSWLLHAMHEMTAQGNRLCTANQTASAQVDLIASLPLSIVVDTRFDPPAVNWRDKKSGSRVIEYADQWHATATAAEKARKLRTLALIRVRSTINSAENAKPVEEDDGSIRLGGWRIQAELDIGKEASLLIEHTDSKVVLAADRTEVTANAKQYELPVGTSILIESDHGIVSRCEDVLPLSKE